MLSPSYKNQRSALRPEFSAGWRKSIATRTSSTGPTPGMDETISVWMAELSALLASSANLRLLTEADRAALLRINSPQLRRSATAARILLRLSLSISANRRLAPSSWCFEQTEFGKPYINPAQNLERFDFSVSHTDEVAMVALGRNVRLGIDVESVDQPLEKSLLDGVCHKSEAAVVQFLPPNQQHRSFVQLWTQKEAYTKMLGLGHSIEFNSLQIEQPKNGFADSRTPIVEGFYVPFGPHLFYAALAIERPVSPRTITVELLTAALAEQATQVSRRAGGAPAKLLVRAS